jgi:hypothetical protein
MMRAIKILCFSAGLTILILHSCVYEFYPKYDKHENTLIVYGFITDKNGPHEIQIFKSSGIYGKEMDTIRGATVEILDNQGNSINLDEAKNGFYYTPKIFAGQLGVRYKINIALKHGDHYESEFVELIDVPEIAELKAEYKLKLATQTTNETWGYQFYIDTDGSCSNQKYLRWEIDETWEYKTPYPISVYWNGTSYIHGYLPRRCWISYHLKDIFVGSSAEYQLNSLSNFPLNFTSEKTEKLRVRYGITVKQYALSEEGYNFWKGNIENSLMQGSIYNKQPYKVLGNIKNIDHPDQTVYGFFEASEVKYKSIAVPGVENSPLRDFGDCQVNVFGDTTAVYFYEWWSSLVSVRNSKCVLCESAGATSVMPDFWE